MNFRDGLVIIAKSWSMSLSGRNLIFHLIVNVIGMSINVGLLLRVRKRGNFYNEQRYTRTLGPYFSLVVSDCWNEMVL